MCPPTASTPIDINFASTDENLFGSLERMIRGTPLPGNVINDVNPYNYMPSNLPEGVWYLVCSKENESAYGQWKAKGEAREIFSNSFITGWKTTLVFYEGQVPHESKTDWIMQEFRITQKRLCKGQKDEDSGSLCRVFLTGKQSSGHEMQQEINNANNKSEIRRLSAQSSFEKGKDDTEQGSTSMQELGHSHWMLRHSDIVQENDDDETRPLAVMDRLANHLEVNLTEIDFFSDGDFLELQDLDHPLSPSSSSDNSSCMTLSSDEYFDSLALLRELEHKKTEGVVPESAGHKYSFSTSHTPNSVVVFPGCLTNVGRNKCETEEAVTLNRAGDSKALIRITHGQEANYGTEGPSAYFHYLASTSHDQIALQNGERMANIGRVKKLRRKYFCFMPF